MLSTVVSHMPRSSRGATVRAGPHRPSTASPVSAAGATGVAGAGSYNAARSRPTPSAATATTATTTMARTRTGGRFMPTSVPGRSQRPGGRRVRRVTVIVVGAGMAGLACARELLDAGVPVRVVERSRVVGGRLASRRVDGRYADIGAGYLTADDHAFQGLLDSWRIRGEAAPWTDTMVAYGPDRTKPESATGPMRWASPGGLRSLAEDLAAELDVTLQHEVRRIGPGPLVDGEPGEAVVLAMPGPQALRLLGPDAAGLRAAAGRQRWSPALAAVLGYRERRWPEFHAAFVNEDPVLAKVFDDGDRRGDRAPYLVAHTTAGFAAQHLDDPDAAGPAI